MPVTSFSAFYPLRKIFRAIGGNKAIAWADEIMAAASGTTSGPNVLEALATKLEETNLIGHGTNNIPADANAPWIFVRTDNHNFFVKERTGSVGSYNYFWQGPFFAGSYESRIIYSAATTPATPVPAWNAVNANFNLSGGDWAMSVANAKWWRIVLLPKDSNTVSMSPLVRIGDPSAADISVDASGFNGNLTSSDDDLQKVAQKLDDLSVSGTGTTQNAAQVPVASSGFDGNLATTDNNVQLVAQKLDDLDIQGARQEFEIDPEDADDNLNNVGATVESDFTVEQRIVNYSNNYQQVLSFNGYADIRFEDATYRGSAPVVTVKFEVLQTSGASFSPAIEQVQRIAISDSVDVRTQFHIAGTLPIGTTGGKLRTTLVSRDQAHPSLGVGWVAIYKGVINADLHASNVVVDRSAFGGNLNAITTPTQQAVDEEIDGLQIRSQTYDDIVWPAEIDDDGTAVTREFPIHRLIVEANRRPEINYTVRGTYTVTGTPLGTVNTISPTITLESENASNVKTTRFTHTETVDTSSGADAIVRPFEVSLPSGDNNLIFSATNPTTVNDIKLVITAHSFVVEQGYNSSGFTESGRILNNQDFSVQRLAEKVYGFDPAAMGGVGGQTARTAAIIWRAGLTATSRITAPSATTRYTLLAGHTWNQYDELEFHFDTAAIAGLGTPRRVDSSWFQSLTYGMAHQTDNASVLVTPIGTNQFTFQWNAGLNIGLREILGINY